MTAATSSSVLRGGKGYFQNELTGASSLEKSARRINDRQQIIRGTLNGVQMVRAGWGFSSVLMSRRVKPADAVQRRSQFVRHVRRGTPT